MLNRYGFVHISTAVTLDNFYGLSHALGEIINKSDINIQLDSDRLYKQSKKIDFHTDGPNTDIIGWFCVKQDTCEGHSILLDSRQIFAQFSREELSLLSTIIISYPMGNGINKEVPLIQRTIDEDPIICYLPWSFFNLNPSQQAIYSAFKDAVSEVANKRLTSIRLHEGEMLFIDNKRILHGRDAIKKNSPRMLKRVWVKCDNHICSSLD